MSINKCVITFEPSCIMHIQFILLADSKELFLYAVSHAEELPNNSLQIGRIRISGPGKQSPRNLAKLCKNNDQKLIL